MGNQNSSAFPNEEIRNSETQQQFLYSIDSQNPKNAKPISLELLDFNKQTNNFVLFTYGEMDFVHYWRCQNIFVAAFAAPKCPIPERTYHYHTYKGMPFITIRCNKNCYQVMNHYMDRARSSITRTEFLNKVISEINSQNIKDSHDNIKDGFDQAPQIRRASPSKYKMDNASTSLAPSLTSIKRNYKLEPNNDDPSIELPTKKKPKVSIQLPTLEDSPHYTNTIDMITYDSVNVSTSFTTDKNISDKDDNEEEINNNNYKNKNTNAKRKLRKPRKNQKKKNEILLEPEDEYDDTDDHEMLSENSEEDEEENSQNSSKQKQVRSKNKILTQNKETGSVQSKLDNQNLSFANGSDAARSALIKRKKKITKKSKKIIKSKKKPKKAGKKVPTSPKNNNDDQTQNIQPNDNQIQQPLEIKKDTNGNKNENNDNIDTIPNISKEHNGFNNNNKFNSKNATSTLDSNNDNNKNNPNNFDIKNRNLNTNDNDGRFNMNNNFNIGTNNNFYANNNYNPNANMDYNSNNNKYDDKNSNNIQPRIKSFINYDDDDDIDSDEENQNQPTNSRHINENDRNKLYNQGKQTPSEFQRQPYIGRDSNSSYTDDEEEDNEKVVKINLKYTNTPDSNINNIFNSREPRRGIDHNEIEEEEEFYTRSSESDHDSKRGLNTREIQGQKPSTGVSLPKDSKEPIQISDPITHSKFPEDSNLLDNDANQQAIHFSFSNPLEVVKSEDKNSSNLISNQLNSSRMQVAHLVEISKFEKPKPKIEIGPIVDISLPETETNTNRAVRVEKGPSQQQQKLSNQNQDTNNGSPNLHNINQKNGNDDSDYDYEYFTVLDDKNNINQPVQPQPNEPLVAILTRSPLTKPKRRRHHHHHHEIRQIEKDDSDYNDQNDENRRKKKHRKRKHHHRHHNNNNNSDNNDYNEDYDSDLRNNNSKRKSPDHHHHHRKTQTRRNDYSDDYDDNSNRNLQTPEKVDKSIQPTVDKSTQLKIASKRTVATSTSFFDKDTKQSQTRESILNKPKEKFIEIEIDYKRKRYSKSTNTAFSDNQQSNNEEYISEEEKNNKKRNSSNRTTQTISRNNKRPQNENEKKVLDKLPSQNVENEPKSKQKIPSKQQDKKYNKNNNEYDDYNYNENEDENENLQKTQTKNNKNGRNSTNDSSGFSAALNTISGIENDKGPNPDKVTSRFIKNNNNTVTNSTISRIDDSTDGSLIQKLLPNNQTPSSRPQQQQHDLQKTKIFPLPENKDSSSSEEEDKELDENQSSSDNFINNIYQEEEEEDSENLTGTINEDDELVVKSRSSRTQSSSSKGSQGQIKKIENIEPITSKSSEVSQFDIFNSDKDNKNSSSSSSKKRLKKKICLRKFDRQNNPESDKFNEFSGSTGTTSSEIGDLENVAKGRVTSDSSSSSSRNQRKKISSGFSSEFEAKEKESDFTTNAFEAFSTDSSQNYPSFNEISEKIQQASLVSCESLKT